MDQKSSPPTITLTPATGTTISKASKQSIHVQAIVHDSAGLRSCSIQSANSSGSSNYEPGQQDVEIGLTFFAAFYPVGPYTFQASAWNYKGEHTTETIVINVVA